MQKGLGPRGREHSLEAPPPTRSGSGLNALHCHRGESIVGHISKHQRETNSLFGRTSDKTEYADSSPFLIQLNLPLPHPGGVGDGDVGDGRGHRLHGGAAQHAGLEVISGHPCQLPAVHTLHVSSISLAISRHHLTQPEKPGTATGWGGWLRPNKAVFPEHTRESSLAPSSLQRPPLPCDSAAVTPMADGGRRTALDLRARAQRPAPRSLPEAAVTADAPWVLVPWVLSPSLPMPRFLQSREKTPLQDAWQTHTRGVST